MSKLFEALQRAGSEPGSIRSVPIPVRPTVEAQVAVPITPIAPPVESAPEETPDPAEIPSQPSNIRTLAIHVTDPAVYAFATTEKKASEEYRIIRTKILQTVKQPAIVLISSPAPGDGKTVTSLNIARSLAIKQDANVLIVDGDLVKGSVQERLGIRVTHGLADVLSGAAALEDALIRVEQLPNLFILPAGIAGSKRTELLDSSRWKDLCDLFRREFPITILDAPPIASVADYDLLQASADAIIMVVRPDHTNRALCQYCLEQMPKDKFLGVVLNAADPSALSSRYGSYGYGYAYGADLKAKE